jgi:hypothetical protein
MRARNIKPGFFKNEQLAEIEPLGRILFTALWCMGDSEGRLEDRPKRIKIEALPYDNLSDQKVSILLNRLQEFGFILRYSVSGSKFIQIINFRKHQNPHIKEAASTIPAPEIPVQVPCEYGSSPADSLIPDSLIPDSLIPEITSFGGCPERSPKNGNGSGPQPKIVFDYSSGEFKGITPDLLKYLSDKFPAIDVDGELKKAAVWCIGNPDKKKVKWLAFIGRWLTRAQEKPPPTRRPPQDPFEAVKEKWRKEEADGKP